MARRQRLQRYALRQQPSTPNANRTHGGKGESAKQFSFSALHCGPRRSLRFEPLEIRNMLSLSAGLPLSLDGNQLALEAETVVADTVSASSGPSTVDFDSMWYDPDGSGTLPSDVPNVESGNFEEFTTRNPWPDKDPDAPGIQLTYSYSNFLDGLLPGGLTPEQLIASTEEALGLWASVAPLNFQEVVDSGPAPSDDDYSSANHPDLRIGHHFIDGSSGPNVLAHAYFPVSTDGLAGDVHFDDSNTWGTISSSGVFDVIEVVTHELGHSLGLGHEQVAEAIMNPFIANRFNGPGTGFLLPDDINGIQSLYGEGTGSVTPLVPIVVDIVDDEDDGDVSEGDLSLREAINMAIEAGGIQRVSFAEALAGETIVLDSSLVINGRVLIDGLGSDQLTIQATDPTVGQANGDGFEVFVIDDGDAEDFSDVMISGLRLTGADSSTAGGAISSMENLTLEDVRIDGNASAEQGGGIYSLGQLNINTSSIENNSAADDGGGIYTLGGITLEGSTVSGNSTGDEGGGISAGGVNTAIVVQSSTISGNTSTGDGGGMHVFDLNPSKLRVWNSTVTQNMAGGSGGGIYEYNGVLVLDHAIVAGNSAGGTAPDIDNVNFFASPVVLAKYSLVGDITGSVISQFDGNLLGNGISPIDPLLEPLADNGGPTKTHKLIAGSPAINAGDPNIPRPPEFDQRGPGFARISLGVIDIGAFESGGFNTTFTVDSLADENDGDYTTGQFTLREAIALANSQPGNGLINFDISLNGGVIELDSSLGEMLIASSVTIDAGDLSGGITLDASLADPTPDVNNGDGIRPLRIDDGDALLLSDVVLEGITLVGGDVLGNGGAIQSQENLELHEVSILGNFANGQGGGIYQQDGSLLVERSTVANNRATSHGGGMWINTTNDDPQIGRIVNSTFSTNTSGGEGGAIYNFDGHLLIEHATITNNSTFGTGALRSGGLFTVSDASTQTSIFSSIVAGNSSPDIVENPRTIGHSSYVSLGYNLIGNGNAILGFDNNDLTEVLNPGLGPLGNNGGRTSTHVPLEGSPAIDASDPSLTMPGDGLPEFDQRGEPFSRLGDGDASGTEILDIGAVEVQTPVPDANFDQDQDVDGFDFLLWQRGFGKSAGASLSDGDSDNDGDVDTDDLAAWEATFGTVGPADSLSSSTGQPALASTTIDVTTAEHVETNLSPTATPMPTRAHDRNGETMPAVAAPYEFYTSRISTAHHDVANQDNANRDDATGSNRQPLRSRTVVADLVFNSTNSDTWQRRRRSTGATASLDFMRREQTDSSSALRSLDAAFEVLGRFDWRSDLDDV